ncbi:MAG: hypothetical protein Q9P14_02695 [candidate division KSB1 bacterium]|nr:hypothetical protein [candidate division KSB1 bacterium]
MASKRCWYAVEQLAGEAASLAGTDARLRYAMVARALPKSTDRHLFARGRRTVLCTTHLVRPPATRILVAAALWRVCVAEEATIAVRM